MQRPKLILSTYPEPYKKEELKELVEPFSAAYDVEFSEIEEEGDLFGLGLYFVFEALKDPTVQDWIIKPLVTGVMGALAKSFVDWIVKRWQRTSEMNTHIPMEIRNVPPIGYSSDHLSSGFYITAKLTDIGTDELQRPAELSSRLTVEFERIDEAFSRLWSAIQQGQVPQGMLEATLSCDPNTGQYSRVECFAEPSRPMFPPQPIPIEHTKYEGDLFAPSGLSWRVAPPTW